MKRVQIVSTPALLEARNLARWIERERVPGVRIAPSRGEWGVFAPAQYAERARRALRRAVAANNPGSYRVVFKLRFKDPYTAMRRRYTFGRSTKIADALVRGMALKAAVLDSKGKVRFVAFKRGGLVASNPGMDKLADAAVMIAAQGARQYLDVHRLKADPAALTACLKSWVKAKFPEALNDAKAAISAGMAQMAEATFAATMKLAGIEAAKEAARPPGASTNRGARGNPRTTQLPMELRGGNYASRLVNYLRKRGISTEMRPVSDKPGWFTFFVRPPQVAKAEALMWEWSNISDTMELTPRQEKKWDAKRRRWRMRVQRRGRRRGVRKEGYYRGGRLSTPPPAVQFNRGHRNPLKKNWTVRFSKIQVLVEDTGQSRKQAIRDARAVASKKWRMPPGYFISAVRSLDIPTAVKSRRNVRSYKTMSDAESWKAMQWMAQHDPTRYQIARRVTMAHLQERMAGTGHGISSSDVNHTMVALIRMGDVIVTPGAPWRKRVKKNAPIESKWPQMTDRQREEALRIVGIERDTAELWAYKSWEELSSVVRILLKRAWKGGGDTTKIRRAPVGAR